MSLQVETALLGAMLLDETSIPEIERAISADDFADRDCRVVYQTAILLWQDGVVPTPGAMRDRLPDHHATLEACELAGLGGSAGDYIAAVSDAAARRRIAHRARVLADLTPRASRDEIQEAIDALVSSQTLARAEPVSMASVLSDVFDRITSDQAPAPAVSWPWLPMENVLLAGGHVVYLAARPGHGKTAMALQTAGCVAETGQNVLFFTVEMTTKDLCLRVLSQRSGVSFKSLRGAYHRGDDLLDSEFAAVKAADIPRTLQVIDLKALSVADVHAVSSRVRNRDGGLGLIVVDYLQLMKTGKEGTRDLELARITRQLKIIAGELDVPVLCLAQLNREVEKRQGNKEPRLSDLRECGSIEADADAVVMLWQPHIYDGSQESQGRARLKVAKNRHGRMGEILDFDWLGPTMTLETPDYSASEYGL